MNYDLEIENAIKNSILDYNNIFEFRDTPNENIFENLYVFCRENLNIHSKRVNISPNIFLFTNDFSINAKAGYRNNQSVILINLGLMKNCFENYLFNTKLDEYTNEKFSELISRFDNPISVLAFQITTQFTYYHELAHLFQFTKKQIPEIELQEREKEEANFNITNHKLEINADTYSAISIATHIKQYIDKSFGDEINVEIINSTIKILGSCIMNYIINFSHDNNIYFDKHSHPHPFLRLLNITMNIANHIESMSQFQEKGIKLDGKNIFESIVDYYRELEVAGIFKTKFTDLIDQNLHLHKDIINYLAELIIFDVPDFEDAMNIWNKHII